MKNLLSLPGRFRPLVLQSRLLHVRGELRSSSLLFPSVFQHCERSPAFRCCCVSVDKTSGSIRIIESKIEAALRALDSFTMYPNDSERLARMVSECERVPFLAAYLQLSPSELKKTLNELKDEMKEQLLLARSRVYRPRRLEVFRNLKTADPLTSQFQELEEFRFKVDEKEDFPADNGGAVLFGRSKFVRKMVDTFTSLPRYLSYYFRNPPGSGKTVLMKLFGRELQRRDFVVYMLNAPNLEYYPQHYFRTLAERWAALQKQVAILVDEVQRNVDSAHWGDLIKETPENLLVIGAGIPDLDHTSPQFKVSYPDVRNGAITHLTVDDMPEVVAHFIPLGEADTLWEAKRNALAELLAISNGHFYPFVKIAEHLLEPGNLKHLSGVRSYLGSQEFYDHKVYVQVQRRCYQMKPYISEIMESLLLGKIPEPGDKEKAMKTGLWTGHNFESSLYAQEVFRRLVLTNKSNDFKSVFHPNVENASIIEQIIVAGLTNMKSDDFVEATYSSQASTERSFSLVWGVAASAALRDREWFRPEVITNLKEEAGGKPTVDWIFNGRFNLGLELAKDGDASVMAQKLEKIGPDGVYGRRHDCYIVHFDLKRTQDSPASLLS